MIRESFIEKPNRIIRYKYHEDPENLYNVQIIHGMKEHIDRYQDFAQFLISHKMNIIMHDLQGHGKSTIEGKLSKVISKESILEDVDEMFNLFSHKRKRIIIGHSMGSFIARYYASKRELDKLILIGTGDIDSFSLMLLKALIKKTKDDERINISNLMDGILKRKCHCKRGESWLSYNKINVLNFIEDPLCGNEFRKSAYKFLVDIAEYIKKDSCYRECKAKHIYLLSGLDDPVGNNSKGVRHIFEKYKEQDYDVNIKIYNNMRHEILNEDQNMKVFNDILAFCTRGE